MTPDVLLAFDVDERIVPSPLGDQPELVVPDIPGLAEELTA